MRLTVIQVGNSLGVILPKELLAYLELKKGDELFVSKTTDGVTLRLADPEFERQMELFREGAHRYRNTLRTLAKA